MGQSDFGAYLCILFILKRLLIRLSTIYRHGKGFSKLGHFYREGTHSTKEKKLLSLYLWGCFKASLVRFVNLHGEYRNIDDC